MVLYDYDSNFIFTQPFRNFCTQTYSSTPFLQSWSAPRLQCCDNECSTLLNEYMDAESIDYQLVSPAVHRRNAAKRAICT